MFSSDTLEFFPGSLELRKSDTHKGGEECGGAGLACSYGAEVVTSKGFSGKKHL